MTSHRRVILVGALAALWMAHPSPIGAQAPVNRALATRADLERLRSGTGTALSGRDRQAIEHRLQEGDFQEGDRVLVSVSGEKALTDTFTVRAGPVLALPDMAPLPMRGVLRSEIEERLTAHVRQYIREPAVTVQPLLRIGILGAVARPGYYSVPADQPLGDMLGVAGGLTADGNLAKTSVSRGGAEYWPRKDVRLALASGQSLDQMGFQGGDEIQVGRRGGGFGPTLAIIGGLATLTTTIVLLRRN